jgi:hypothetical protein
MLHNRGHYYWYAVHSGTGALSLSVNKYLPILAIYGHLQGHPANYKRNDHICVMYLESVQEIYTKTNADI